MLLNNKDFFSIVKNVNSADNESRSFDMFIFDDVRLSMATVEVLSVPTRTAHDIVKIYTGPSLYLASFILPKPKIHYRRANSYVCRPPYVL